MTEARLHYGWVIVAAGFTVMFLTYGVQYGFGLFFAALTAEFGWSRASLSGVFSLYAGTYSFTGVIVGRLTDPWGPERGVAVGGPPPPLPGPLGGGGGGMAPACVRCGPGGVGWSPARRGAAVGLVMSGAGVG